MKNSYKFFRNTDCEYFPCHRTDAPETFNCLFCYCPLYFLPDCGGDFRMRNGIKDCTDCLKPHEPGGYERTLEKLRERFARDRRENR